MYINQIAEEKTIRETLAKSIVNIYNIEEVIEETEQSIFENL